MNNTFQLERFLNLIRLRWIMHRKVWLIQAGAFAGIAFIITGLLFSDREAASNPEMFEGVYHIFYFLLLILTGIYLASRSFAEYKDTSSAFSYMMLPASTFEKFLIPAFFSGIFYFIVFTVFYTLLAWLTNIFWGFIYQYDVYFFTPFYSLYGPPFQLLFLVFMVLQPLFLFGSVAMRRHQFIVTGLIIFTFIIASILLAMLVHRMVHGSKAVFSLPVDEKILRNQGIYIFALALHAILQVAVFLKLKEKEV